MPVGGVSFGIKCARPAPNIVVFFRRPIVSLELTDDFISMQYGTHLAEDVLSVVQLSLL